MFKRTYTPSGKAMAQDLSGKIVDLEALTVNQLRELAKKYYVCEDQKAMRVKGHYIKVLNNKTDPDLYRLPVDQYVKRAYEDDVRKPTINRRTKVQKMVEEFLREKYKNENLYLGDYYKDNNISLPYLDAILRKEDPQDTIGIYDQSQAIKFKVAELWTCT